MTTHRGGLPGRLGLILLALLLVACGSGRRVAPAADPTSAATPATESPAPLQVQLEDGERAELEAQLATDLELAEAVAATRPASSGLSEEERERWETLAQYIELARASQSGGDLRAAADLAQKARLLAERLGAD